MLSVSSLALSLAATRPEARSARPLTKRSRVAAVDGRVRSAAPLGFDSRGSDGPRGRRKREIGAARAIRFAEERGCVLTDQGARLLPRGQKAIASPAPR